MAPTHRRWNRRAFCIATLGAVLLYQFPYVLTLAKTGWTVLPPVLEADQTLYFNLSNIQRVSDTQVVNPWYGDPVSAVDVPHLRFSITFVLFHLTHRICQSWTLAMLVWAAIWAALMFIAAVFCLDSLFPSATAELKLAIGLALLVLQPPWVYLAEFTGLPNLAGFFQLHLPYLRFAIPQVIVPVVFAYVGLQSRVLKQEVEEHHSRWLLAAMVILQFAVCISFPYFLPVLATGTAFAILLSKLSRSHIAWSWTSVLSFGAICGLLDLGYLALGGLGKSHGNVQFVPHFRPEMILPCVRPFVVCLVVVSTLAMFSRASIGSKATAAGLAFSNALFGFCDVFFRPEAQILGHPHYLIALTTWLPIFVFAVPHLGKIDLRALSATILVFALMFGLWEGFASYRSSIASNILQAAAISEVKKLSLTQRDLVVATAQFADDISSWIPLVSRARVLYTPDGENILSAADTQTEQPFRQAIYLSIAGVDTTILTAITAKDRLDNRFDPLLQQGDRGYQRSPLIADRLHARSLVEARLSPLLARLNSEPAAVIDFLQAYNRIIIIEGSDQTLFNPSSFQRWIHIDKSYENNGVRVWVCHVERPTSAWQ